jgi:soluble lytic murein transglycosylase-like protein
MWRVVAFACVVFATAAAASPDSSDERASSATASNRELLPVPDARAERSSYREIIAREARTQNLPFEIADTVVRIESGYRADAIGDVGEVGLMQVRPTTAAMLGFRGTAAELADPETNIRYGVMYLAKAWRLGNGDLCRVLMKYRAGHGEQTISPLSAEYCRRARLHLASLGWTQPGSSTLDRAAAPSTGSAAFGIARAVARTHPLLIASRTASAEALSRVSARARSGALWAAHAVRVEWRLARNLTGVAR